MPRRRLGLILAAGGIIACASAPPAPSPAVTREPDSSVAPAIRDVPANSMPGTTTPPRDPNAPRHFFEVEMTATATTVVKPVYPESLRQSRVRGFIAVEFVVDTLGAVEPGGFTLLEVVPKSAESAFMEAVRAALLASRYQPAQFAGRKVRQRVPQRFEFNP